MDHRHGVSSVEGMTGEGYALTATPDARKVTEGGAEAD